MSKESFPLIGISTLVDYSVPVLELLRKVKAAGFSAIAFGHKVSHFPYFNKRTVERVADECAKLSLYVDYIHAPIDLYLDLTSPNERVRDATIDTYRFTIDAVYQMKGRAVTAHLCNVDYLTAEEIEERAKLAVQPVRELMEYAWDRGVLFCLENLPYPYPYERLFERFLEVAEEKSLMPSICIDTCHINIHNPEPFSFIEEHAQQIGETHLSDNFGDRDIHLPPYSGNFDFQRLAREMAKAGYSGNIMLENSYEAAVKRFEKGINSPEEPTPGSLEEYLEVSANAAKRFREDLLGAKKKLAS